MIHLEIASLITQILIGAGQIGVILYGISRMVQANDSRSKLQSELMKRQEQESVRRHTENMAALQALIRGLDTQGQALKDQGQALQRQGQALQRQGQALETLIARTGG